MSKRTCEVPVNGQPCGEPHRAKGMCYKHYQAAYQVTHRAENVAYLAKFAKANPERRRQQLRASHLRRKYQMSMIDYDALLAKQQGRCANVACGASAPGGRGEWCIDHDHACCETTPICGECIRGLLCWNCNVCAGHQNDDPVRLRGLADYLEQN